MPEKKPEWKRASQQEKPDQEKNKMPLWLIFAGILLFGALAASLIWGYFNQHHP